MYKFLFTVLAVILFSSSVFAHSWYDEDCCGGNDCEPVKVQTDSGGNYAVLKNGQKWYIDKPSKPPRPSKDDDYHVCIHMNQVWCLYVPTGI